MIRRPKSIRTWLLYGLASVLLLAFLAIGFFAYLVSAHEAEEVFDAQLATSARVLAALSQDSRLQPPTQKPLVIDLPSDLRHPNDDAPVAGGHPYENKLAFQVWDAQEGLLARSRNAPKSPLGPPSPGFHDAEVDGQRWHAFVLETKDFRIHTAERADIRDEISTEIVTAIMVPLAMGGLILMVVVNLLARRAVRPVLGLANQISSRKAHDLEPFETFGLPRELRPVVQELNLLLQRVRESMGREQRFLDAAAHELRTPLTAVQLHLENAMSTSTPSEHQMSLQQAQDACRRTVRLAEQLLAYSRVSAAGFESRAPVDLGATAESVAEMMEPILKQRGQYVQLHIQDQVMIPAVRFKIEQLIQNLLANAASHGAASTGIYLSVRSTRDHAELTIRNEGPTLPEAELTKVLIPHYRVQGTKAEGNGLGLAIVQEIVSQHRGEIRLENQSAPPGVRVVVQLPSIRDRAPTENQPFLN